MWLVTPIGFFSIVQKPGDEKADTLTIRSRAKGDLHVLRLHNLPSLGEVIANAGHSIQGDQPLELAERLRVELDACSA